MSIQPEGEQIRKAVRWISGQREENPGANLSKLIGEACALFDLSPKDTDVLIHFLTAGGKEEQK